jgi:hypothetical protein
MTKYLDSKVKTGERPIAFTALSSVCFVFVFLYVYFINGAIVATVAHSTAHTGAVALASSMSELESEYFTLSSAVDTDYANTRGFVVPKSNPQYLSLKVGSSNLSFNRGL